MNKELKIKEGSLRAGHRPAVKAGGRRVPNKQGNEENAAPEKHLKKNVSERPSAVINMTRMQTMNILAGTLVKLGNEFPAEAAQASYIKPRPTVEKTVIPRKLLVIQQPRRF
ncbi:death-associated protein-like 1 [Discoglossus pictus]